MQTHNYEAFQAMKGLFLCNMHTIPCESWNVSSARGFTAQMVRWYRAVAHLRGNTGRDERFLSLAQIDKLYREVCL